jgi:hypothetical protein
MLELLFNVFKKTHIFIIDKNLIKCQHFHQIPRLRQDFLQVQR